MKPWLTGLLFYLLLIAGWHVAAASGKWSPLLLPSPSDVLSYFNRGIADGSLLEATANTLYRLLLGYLAALIIGIPLGMLNAGFQLFEYTVGTVALALQALPSICWAPLAILWFGQSEPAIFFIIVMGSLWSIVIATDNGIRQISPTYIRAAKTLGSRGMHTWFQVMLPAAFPSIFHGMKQGWAFAWRSLMAAEIYIPVAKGFGLGELLHINRELLSMDGVIAVMSIVILIGLIMHALLFSPIERLLYRRWGLNKLS